jgi:hypothetical protein
MRAVLKTKCGATKEVDVPPDRRGRPPELFRVPILLSERQNIWEFNEPISPYGPTYCARVFRCEFRYDDQGRVVYSEHLSVTSMTVQERWEANLEWPSEVNA